METPKPPNGSPTPGPREPARPPGKEPSSSAIRTVKLELLRHGPAHNYLLSPLTQYLALCGNHDAQTAGVGVEHRALLLRIQQMRYEMGPAMAATALREASEEVTRLLASIPSLTAELATSDPEEGKRKIHLRIVLSSSELALLPFELAKAYTGLQGPGQFMSLQTVSPVCITRETRRVAASTFAWPEQVRILVISAAPPPMAAVPLREHMQAIQRALEPYMEHQEEDGPEFDQEFRRSVTFLEEASVASIHKAIAQACSDGSVPYTHVHILAHGIAIEGGIGEAPRYGLALHDAEDPNKLDIVNGERLAAALVPIHSQYAKHARSKPVVLTIASCDSAHQGNVLAPGASVAHELHEHGIPLVIGSQFPLSVKGSVLMAEELYEHLLRGTDPRDALILLRKKLRALLPDSIHDWASLVVYTALPTDLDDQLKRFSFIRARLALKAIMSRIDNVKTRGPQQLEDEYRAQLLELKRQLLTAVQRLKDAVPREGGGIDRVSALGFLASASKQAAEIVRRLGPSEIAENTPGARRRSRTPPARRRVAPAETEAQDSAPLDELTPEALQEEQQAYLEEAQQYYYDAYQTGARDSWPLVQYLVLDMAKSPGRTTTQDFQDRWIAAKVLSADGLKVDDVRRRVWALSSLVELMVLAADWPDRAELGEFAAREQREKAAQRYVKDLLDLVFSNSGKCAFDGYSLYRQLDRYVQWGWGTPAMRELIQRLLRQMKDSGVAKRHWSQLGPTSFRDL